MRRTWGRRGETPVLVVPFNWKRLSAIASLITTPRARRVGLCLRLLPHTVKARDICRYLQQLKVHVCGRGLVLLWDRLPAHRSKRVQRYLEKQRDWLTVEYLPAYAPELNPVEDLWSYIDGHEEVANGSWKHLSQVRKQVHRAARDVRRGVNLGRSFLKHSRLF